MNFDEKSCGCIIIEKGKVLLIKQTDGFWGFPKGHIEENETEVETAKREVMEETNLEVEINESKRYEMNYVTSKGASKQVVLFIAKLVNGEIEKQECEILDAKWLGYEDALETLSFENTKEVLKLVKEEF